MAKLLVTLAVLSVFGAVLVKGFDKKASMEKFMVKVEECKPETGATEADLAEMFAKKPASTREGKCMRACLMKKCEVMDSNGKFVKAIALGHAEKYTDGAADKMKTAHEIIDACASIAVSDDHCDASEQYGKCFKEQVEARGIKDDFEF